MTFCVLDTEELNEVAKFFVAMLFLNFEPNISFAFVRVITFFKFNAYADV